MPQLDRVMSKDLYVWICNRLDEFKEIVLDFDRKEVMGQGVADD